MPFSTLHQHALTIFQAGVKAADPSDAIQRSMWVENGSLYFRLKTVNSNTYRNGLWSKVHIIAFGKAAVSMTRAVQNILRAAKIDFQSLVVTNDENFPEYCEFPVLPASHPLPDQRGLNAALRIVEQLSQTQAGELVLVLISGGGSALIPLPISPVTLADKSITTDLLLASGATIQEINCVRKHLSQLKGGRLTQLAMPAAVHALILSDVIGDDVSAIASGTTVADESTYQQALEILQNYQIVTRVPESVIQLITQGCQGKYPETAKKADPVLIDNDYTIIGSNILSLQASVEAAKNLGFDTSIYHSALTGIAREVAEQWVLQLKFLINKGINQATALLAGGETTIKLQPNSGLGGRNQEFALAFAIAAERHRLPKIWTLLAAGTDGRDGMTTAAGAIIDANSIENMFSLGFDPIQHLENHNAFPILQAANNLVITGATATNVADLQIVLLQPK